MSILDNPIQVMHHNLEHVFGESDAEIRLRTINSIYSVDGELHDQEGTFRGAREISEAVGKLLQRLPGIQFSAVRPALFLNGVGRLPWLASPRGGPISVTGLDVAIFEGLRIKSLHVFLDQPIG